MDSRRRHALVAGLLYLVVALTGPFVLLYVPAKLYVASDAVATAQNILAHTALVRAHIVVGLISELAFLCTVLALYRLLRGVSAEHAAVMLVLALITVPIAFLDVANEAATLRFLLEPGFLGAFTGAQRDAVATLLLMFDLRGVGTWQLFWGLWLLPLGVLVYRSGFLPRFVGGWLLLNGAAYVVASVTTVFSPAVADGMGRWFMPLYVGEIALMIALLVVGFRAPRGARET
jgi:hypothetical protein